MNPNNFLLNWKLNWIIFDSFLLNQKLNWIIFNSFLLNQKLNWIIFEWNSIIDWIVKLYLPGLLQAQGRDYDCVPFTNVCINGHVCINTDSKRRSPKWQIWWWNTSLSQMSCGSAAACCLTASSGFKFNSLSIWKFDEFAKRGRVLIIMSNLVNSVWEKTAVFSQL